MKQSIYNLVEMKRKFHAKIFTFFLRMQFAFIGKNSVVHPSVTYYNPAKIYISDNCEIREGVILNGRSDCDVGIFLGKNVKIRSYSYIDCYGSNGFVKLDDGASIGQQVIIGGNGGVKIGKDVMISGLTYILSASRVYNPNIDIPYRDQGEVRKPVTIKNNVWIAAHCMIFAGVTIGENSIIGAGSVVTSDIPPNVLAYGIPATVKKEITGEEFLDTPKELIYKYIK